MTILKTNNSGVSLFTQDYKTFYIGRIHSATCFSIIHEGLKVSMVKRWDKSYKLF